MEDDEIKSQTYGLFDPDNRRIRVPLSNFLELFGVTSISFLLRIFREWEDQNHGLDRLRDNSQQLYPEGATWPLTNGG